MKNYRKNYVVQIVEQWDEIIEGRVEQMIERKAYVIACDGHMDVDNVVDMHKHIETIVDGCQG